jgi:hypothetical protein
VFGREPDLDRLQPDEALQEETCADEQHQRKRRLDNDQGLSQMPPGYSSSTLAVLEIGQQIDRAGLKRRAAPKSSAAPTVIARAKSITRESMLTSAGEMVYGVKKLADEMGTRASKSTAHTASATPSTPPMADSTSASTSSWRTRRHRLAPTAPRMASSRSSCRASCEQETGDVGARDQQHETDCAEQDEHAAARVTGSLLSQRNDPEAPPRIGAGIPRAQFAGDCLGLGICGLWRDIRQESSNRTDRPDFARVLTLHEAVLSSGSQRSVSFGKLRNRKLAGSTPTTVTACPSTRIGLPTTVGICTKTSLPQARADDCHRRQASSVLLEPERTAAVWRDAKQREQLGGDNGMLNQFRLRAPGQGRASGHPDGKLRKRAIGRAKVRDVRQRQRQQVGAFAWFGAVHQSQAVAVDKRQRLEQVALATEKMAVVAPMPSPSVAMATVAKPGWRAASASHVARLAALRS